MRGAHRCAQRLKSLFASLRSKLGKVNLPSAGDPVTQMTLGVLSRDVPESKAREALDRIRGLVVDYNELRVIPPIELAATVGEYPDVRLKCEDMSRALNRIFALVHTVSLDHLAGTSPKEVQNWLEKIDGLEAYTRARVRLLGLRQHAIPLDEAMWAYARQRQIVGARCPLPEAQAFLERQIPPEQALEFVALFKRQAWAECGAAVRKGEVERILSIPPDRTTRNMLQLVGAASQEEAAIADGPELVEAPELLEEAAFEEPDLAARKSAGRVPRRRSSAAGTREGKPAARAGPRPGRPTIPKKQAPVTAGAGGDSKPKEAATARAAKSRAKTRSA